MNDNFICRFSDLENSSICEINKENCLKNCETEICKLCNNNSKNSCSSCIHNVNGVFHEVIEKHIFWKQFSHNPLSSTSI